MTNKGYQKERKEGLFHLYTKRPVTIYVYDCCFKKIETNKGYQKEIKQVFFGYQNYLKKKTKSFFLCSCIFSSFWCPLFRKITKI